MVSSKGCALKVVDGYKFRKVHKNIRGQVWRCAESTCSVRFVTNRAGNEMLEKPSKSHGHPAPENLAREFVSNAAKIKASRDIFEKPSEVVAELLPKVPSEFREELRTKDLEYIRHNVLKCRRELIPLLPKNVDIARAKRNKLKILKSLRIKKQRERKNRAKHSKGMNVIVFNSKLLNFRKI